MLVYDETGVHNNNNLSLCQGKWSHKEHDVVSFAIDMRIILFNKLSLVKFFIFRICTW